MSKFRANTLASGPFFATAGGVILGAMAGAPEIIGGPTPIQAPREGETYRWKVQNGRAEQHVYVQIADSLHPEAFDEPLRWDRVSNT